MEEMGGHLSINGRNVAGLDSVSYESRLLRAIDRSDKQTTSYLIEGKKVDLDKVELGHNALNLAIHRRNINFINMLVQAGCNLDLCSMEHLIPPLMQVLMLGRMDILNILVDNGCDINIQSPENLNSALHISIIHRNNKTADTRPEELLQYLVSKGANVNLQDHHGRTPLHLCAEANYVAAMEFFLSLDYCQLDLANTRARQTPLHEAVEAGSQEAALLLINAGADINRKDIAGCCPLLLAVEHHQHSITEHLLNRQNIIINNVNNDKWSVLHEAAKAAEAETVDLLIKHGVSVNLQDNNGNSALHIAARQGHSVVVQLLLEKGARHELPNKEGKSPLYLAVVTNKIMAAHLLLKSGAEINQRDKVNKSPLHAAVYQGNTRMVQMLISLRANVNVMDKHGRTPLLLASKHGRYEEAVCLLNAGANPDLYTGDDKGPLHMAIIFPKLDFPMIHLLLESGCDPLNLVSFIDWIQQNGIVKYDEFTRSEMFHWYNKLRKMPTTLKHSCRTVIQTMLRRLYHDEQVYRSVLDRVHLPSVLKDYLCVKML